MFLRSDLWIYYTTLAIILLLLNITCNVQRARAESESDNSIARNTVCKQYAGLVKKQKKMCSKHPETVASAIQGMKLALHDCEQQLKDRRWNCSSLESKTTFNPHSSITLKRGFKESSFVYSLMAAGVAHQVTSACAEGKLGLECGCDGRPEEEDSEKKQWEWEGCSHDVRYGEKFSKRFLDARENGRDLHSRTIMHNNALGRQAVSSYMERKCQCHGTSGSCEVKTCWKAVPPFRGVSDRLKKQYDRSVRVRVKNDNRGQIFVVPVKKRLKLLKTDLIHYERSPDYCTRNPSVESLGTQGRRCNKTSNGMDSCEVLCCGRGYNVQLLTRTESCNCVFHWCCTVECDKCVVREWVHTCK